MNNDIVNSIISQHEQGFISEMMIENEVGTNKAFEKETKIGALARISTSFYKFLGAEAEATAENTNKNKSENHQVSKEIVQKTLYDAAYNIAYENIDSEFTLREISGDLGEYIELTGSFQFIDFDALQSLFVADGLISYLKKMQIKEMEAEVNNEANKLNRATQSNNQSKLKSEIKKLNALVNKQYDEISEILKALKSIIPYTRMLISNNGFVIPMDDKCLRDDPATFGFKYGGEMTCVGYITNIFGKDCGPIDDSDIFFSLQHSINEVLRALLPTKEENLYIVNPIAIYYKNGEINETKTY